MRLNGKLYHSRKTPVKGGRGGVNMLPLVFPSDKLFRWNSVGGSTFYDYGVNVTLLCKHLLRYNKSTSSVQLLGWVNMLRSFRTPEILKWIVLFPADPHGHFRLAHIRFMSPIAILRKIWPIISCSVDKMFKKLFWPGNWHKFQYFRSESLTFNIIITFRCDYGPFLCQTSSNN